MPVWHGGIYHARRKVKCCANILENLIINTVSPWYRKAYYYKCKKDKMDEIIAKYKEPEELADPKYVKKLKRI